ncbi:MAG: hypothetical protein ACJ76J_25690 [Thermoanaerobaculia bacterium]
MLNRCALLAGLALWAASPLLAQANKKFVPGCTLPFAAIAVEHSIDKICGIEGTGSAATRAQSRVKNNFCAPGPPVDVEITNLVGLQEAVEELSPPFPFGPDVLPSEDRSRLHDLLKVGGVELGEGDLVRLVAFVDFPHNAGKESVNCKLEAGDAHPSRADLHVEVVEAPGDGPCQRVSIELVPHFRPRAWTEEAFDQIKAAGVPIRITGQLMFDASHDTCNQGGNFRASNWEIHPVYRVEVCKKLGAAGCSGWIELSNWQPPGAFDVDVDLLSATAAPAAEVRSLPEEAPELLAVVGVDGAARVQVVSTGDDVLLRAANESAAPKVKKGRLAFVLGWLGEGEILGAQVLGYLEKP